MTIYRHEENRGGKRHARYAKFPLLSPRKRNSLKGLPPIYEADEDCEELPFLETKDNKNSLRARKVEDVHREFHAASIKTLQRNATIPHAQKTLTNETRPQQQQCRESQDQDRTETCPYLKRNLGHNLSTCRVERNNQILFPDFFPPGMHVHCAQNALPEASKGLYMKIIQGNSEIEATSNFCKTNKRTNLSDNAGKQPQSWMQFFG